MQHDSSTLPSHSRSLGCTISCGRFFSALVRASIPSTSFPCPLTHKTLEWNRAILILQYWVREDTVSMWAWVLIFWAFFSVLTTLGVVAYGEIEYYLGWFKIISLGACFFISFLVNVGAFGNGHIGFKYWTPPQGPVVNGINGFGQVFALAASYCVGTEVISLAAGETKNPRKSIPRYA